MAWDSALLKNFIKKSQKLTVRTLTYSKILLMTLFTRHCMKCMTLQHELKKPILWPARLPTTLADPKQNLSVISVF